MIGVIEGNKAFWMFGSGEYLGSTVDTHHSIKGRVKDQQGCVEVAQNLPQHAVACVLDKGLADGEGTATQ